MNESPVLARKPLTLHRLREMHAAGEKIAMLTCYDASFARLLDGAGVDCLLVGDSLGMVLQGQATTVPVTLQQMAYHTECVARGNRTAWIVGDLPFGSYQESREQAIRSATTLMQAGAHMVKLEGGDWTAETVRFLTERGIPVCAHLGLTPQSVHALGGYRIQGRSDEAARTLKGQARELAGAGAAMLVLELIPRGLAAEVSAALPIPVIGIGAGVALQRPGAGAARHARHHRRQAAALRAQLHARQRRHRRSDPALRGGREGPELPRRRTAQLLERAPCS